MQSLFRHFLRNEPSSKDKNLYVTPVIKPHSQNFPERVTSNRMPPRLYTLPLPIPLEKENDWDLRKIKCQFYIKCVSPFNTGSTFTVSRCFLGRKLGFSEDVVNISRLHPMKSLRVERGFPLRRMRVELNGAQTLDEQGGGGSRFGKFKQSLDVIQSKWIK